MSPALPDASILEMATVDTPTESSLAETPDLDPSGLQGAAHFGGSDPFPGSVQWSFETDGSFLAAAKFRTVGSWSSVRPEPPLLFTAKPLIRSPKP